jgi:hypothetical protein
MTVIVPAGRDGIHHQRGKTHGVLPRLERANASAARPVSNSAGLVSAARSGGFSGPEQERQSRRAPPNTVADQGVTCDSQFLQAR